MKVRELIKLIEEDGWFLIATRGSHRQYKHLVKAGRVTVPGKPSDDLARHSEQHFKTGRSEGEALMRHAVVIEKAKGNFSAYVPDLPGCIATGFSIEEVEQEIRDAIRFHIEGLKADGLPIPEPTSIAEYVEA
jgi:predicted RNase H-like HicB family nuclease/predicted RNA binding protein YcfA (HicA-like mRNA interferase family)